MSEIKRTRPLLKFRRRLDYIDVDRILPNVHNPREPITRREVTDILESIKNMGGVLVPIVVYKEGENYVLLDGERRWRACKKLSRQDPSFKKIPANIIGKPLTPLQNLQTMFNIHQKRKEWSTAAKAEAIGKLLELKGDLSVGELVELTGLDDTTVSDALLLQKFPKKVRMRCLNGDLNEFYPILLARNLRSLERTFPSIFKKYSWRHLASTFLKKVDKGYIRRTRDFNKLGQMAKSCIEYNSEQLFVSMFQKMVEEERFTPADAQKEVRRELGYKLEEAFKSTCAEFLRSLKSYLKSKPSIDEIPRATREKLTEIYQILKRLILQKRIA
jgi:ParB/RepB/Spo0J family partition protein